MCIELYTIQLGVRVQSKPRYAFIHTFLAACLLALQQLVSCTAASGDTFTVPYDYLVVAVGSETSTFGIPGVAEHAYFLKVRHLLRLS